MADTLLLATLCKQTLKLHGHKYFLHARVTNEEVMRTPFTCRVR